MSLEPVQVFPNKGQGHAEYMEMALKQATIAFETDEIPIGAVVVENGTIIGRGFNQRETLKDPTAHAEMIAITAVANTRGDWRLNDSVLYVTKEPCPMCAGAIVNSRMKMVVFGCYDEQEGCCGSLYQNMWGSSFWNQSSRQRWNIRRKMPQIDSRFLSVETNNKLVDWFR